MGKLQIFFFCFLKVNQPNSLAINKAITDLACQLFRWPSVALYDTLGKDAVQYVMNHAEIKVVVVAGKQLDTFLGAAAGKGCKSLEVANQQDHI